MAKGDGLPPLAGQPLPNLH